MHFKSDHKLQCNQSCTRPLRRHTPDHLALCDGSESRTAVTEGAGLASTCHLQDAGERTLTPRHPAGRLRAASTQRLAQDSRRCGGVCYYYLFDGLGKSHWRVTRWALETDRAKLNHAVKHCCVALAQRSRLCDLITTQMGITIFRQHTKGLT